MSIREQPYTMIAGGALKRPDYDKPGMDELVEVSAQVAQRCTYLRTSYFGDRLCAVFRDPKTGDVYAQPVD